MRYRLQVHPYQHRFKSPLHTSHGVWEVRAGVLITLIDDRGQRGRGEIAPIPWFGSETVEQALAFCQQGPEWTDEQIFAIPDELPACQFGFESAWEALQRSGATEPAQEPNAATPTHPDRLHYSRLLPAGAAALHTWQPLWQQGCRTFKWKIGVYLVAEELALFDQLIQALPPSTQLRLDANGGLSLEAAHIWLKTCDRASSGDRAAKVEYFEQPLPTHQLRQMQALSHLYTTPLALDESVTTLRQLQACYDQGWRGVFVIKPAIAGSPARLRQFCQTHAIDAVFSTGFETTIGRQAGLWLAAELSGDRAVGYAGDFHQFDYFESPLAVLDACP